MIKGIIFDKDGTLFDFNATWGIWTRLMIQTELTGDAGGQGALAQAMGFDLATGNFQPGSIVVAATAGEIAELMLPFVPDTNVTALLTRMNDAASQVPQIETTPLGPFLIDLRAKGFRLGVATNDAEAPARHHLRTAGVINHFDFIAGYDSGHGGKPAPGQLRAFCTQTGLSPDQCAMVGDSLHDLHAGRAAGMTTIGVLTGPARADELRSAADVVLSSIADIPVWLNT